MKSQTQVDNPTTRKQSCTEDRDFDDPKTSVSEKENLNQSQNPMGEKENASETGKDEEKQKDKNCESKEKKSLMKKLFGCFSCCVRPQKKQKQEMVT